MPTDVGTVIAAVGVCGGLVGGAVALFNSRKAVCWKRAELANSYMKDFNNSEELEAVSKITAGEEGINFRSDHYI